MFESETTPRQIAIDYAVHRNILWPVAHTAFIEMCNWANTSMIEECFPFTIAEIRKTFNEIYK